MIDQFGQDTSPYKRKIVMLIIITAVSLVLCLLCNYFCSTYVESQAALYVKSKEKQEWMKSFDFDKYNEILVKLPKACKISNIETVQQHKLALFDKHKLKVVSINNTPDQGPVPQGKGLNYKSTTAVVTGSWESIMACLNEFEVGDLVVVTDFNIDVDKGSGQLNAKLIYRVYYI